VLVVAGVLAVLVVAFGVAGARPLARSVPTVSDERQREVAAAAREFGVPEPVLLAVSAALTGWGATGDPGVPGDAGLFALTDRAPALDGRGTGALPAADEDPAVRTLGAAAALLRLPPERVRSSPADAARGAAALLRQYALDAGGGRLPAALPGWYGAVARFGTGDAMTGRAFADDVFALLRTGVPATVVHSQRFALPARPDAVLPPAPGTGRGFGAAAPAQCPAGLSCRFVPAAGYDPAERPAGSLRTAVVSDAPAGYTATVVAAVRASSAWSPHYVVRASDGAVTQTVRLEDVAWHSGDPTVNAASVGIAVERGPGGPSPAAYRSVGRLLRWLAAGGGPPLDRAHLLGAGEVSGAPVPLDAAWDWGRVLAGAGAPLRARAFRADRVVTVAAPGLVLRAEPAEDAPALAARPAVGRSMAVAERRGDWTAVWYGGRTGWFRDPGGTATLPGDAERVIPVPGRDGVPVYGTVSGAAPKALPERALAGQAYVLLDTAAVQAPSGAYLPIGFGDRVGFVRADDVRLDGLG
jgi:hypothetical protein